MNEFFKFLFSPDIQQEILREGWIKLYEYSYVDDKIINHLNANQEKLSELLQFVNNKASGLGGSTTLSLTGAKSSIS